MLPAGPHIDIDGLQAGAHVGEHEARQLHEEVQRDENRSAGHDQGHGRRQGGRPGQGGAHIKPFHRAEAAHQVQPLLANGAEQDNGQGQEEATRQQDRHDEQHPGKRPAGPGHQQHPRNDGEIGNQEHPGGKPPADQKML
ncbi:MAG: hypothetical protein COZ12_01245 [Deltaproteobacteria bacterium CG_4_10_14_3_um_filter_60_8]|nr:MAG: hypothetical protein COZ12_01245 [Deltaproteobacteria bacterium CG_4_10_14_3_um_filter_60_8]